MPPIAEPTAPLPRCLNCGAALPEPKPALCPNCGASLQTRPMWQIVLAQIGMVVLALAAMVFGGFGACMVLLGSAEGGVSSLFSLDAWWVWGCLLGSVLCLVAAVFLFRWVNRKPK